MSVDATKQVSVIEKSIEVFKTGPAILKNNQERSAKALIVGQSILEQWEAAWKIEDPQERLKALAAADERSNKYLFNSTTAKSEMYQVRAVITQMMTEYARMFTAAENEIDKTKPGTVPAKVQSNRDAYAKALADEEKRKQKEAEEIAAKAKARIDRKTKIAGLIAARLNDYLARKKNLWTGTFNEITLEDISEKSTNLANLECSFPLTRLNAIISYQIDNSPYSFSFEEFKKIDEEAFSEFDFTSYYDQYTRDLTELKQSLIDRLPSKKTELQAIAKAAEEERIRQEEIAKADGERKKKLEEEAKAAELQRREQTEVIRKREAEEAERLRKEAEEKQKQSQLELDLKSQAEQTMVLFEKEAAVSELTPKPETRTGYDIDVLHPVGYTQIFQFYFEKEGKTLAIPDLGRMTLDRMKAFCERYALKNGEKIDSKFLQYKDTHKAVNRKIA